MQCIGKAVTAKNDTVVVARKTRVQIVEQVVGEAACFARIQAEKKEVVTTVFFGTENEILPVGTYIETGNLFKIRQKGIGMFTGT